MTDTQKLTLQAEIRTAFGKKIRRMRKEGLLPSNIFGQDFESKAITIKALDFTHIYKKAGETSVIYIEVGKDSIPTLVSDMHYDPRSGFILHVDFRKVNLKKKIEANVPLVFIGESEAVEQKNGVLITNLDQITVEALPTDIPHQIEIDLSALKEIGDHILVSSLASSTSYTVIDDPETVIVSVTEHKEESIEPETVTEAPEITSEVPAEEGAATEGEAPAKEE